MSILTLPLTHANIYDLNNEMFVLLTNADTFEIMTINDDEDETLPEYFTGNILHDRFGIRDIIVMIKFEDETLKFETDATTLIKLIDARNKISIEHLSDTNFDTKRKLTDIESIRLREDICDYNNDVYINYDYLFKFDGSYSGKISSIRQQMIKDLLIDVGIIHRGEVIIMIDEDEENEIIQELEYGINPSSIIETILNLKEDYLINWDILTNVRDKAHILTKSMDKLPTSSNEFKRIATTEILAKTLYAVPKDLNEIIAQYSV